MAEGELAAGAVYVGVVIGVVAVEPESDGAATGVAGRADCVVVAGWVGVETR